MLYSAVVLSRCSLCQWGSVALHLACVHLPPNNKPFTLSVCNELKRFSYDLEKWFR